MATQGANNRRGKNITEVNNVDSRNESAPSLSHSTGPLPVLNSGTKALSDRNVKARASIFAIVNSPGGIRRCICSANFHPKCWSAIGCVRFSSAPCFHKRCCSQIVDTTRTGSGSFPASQKHGRTSAEAKSQRPDVLWPVSVSRAELGCAPMSSFPKICREFYRAFHP